MGELSLGGESVSAEPSLPALILSVDDQDSNRYVRSRVLRAAGFEVIEAANGADTLALALEYQPSLIVLDIRLPDIDGFEVCNRLKSNPNTASILVLHVSAIGAMEHDLPEALKHRSDAYLREPIAPETLIATVNALIRAREAERRQHEAEERAWQAERYARDILESIADPVVAFDKQWRYTYVSRRASQALGKAPGEMIGKSMWDLFPDDADTGFQEACERAWAENQPVTVERYSHVLGVWIESYIYPFENGASTQWRDITERKSREEMIGFREAFDHLPFDVAVHEGPDHRVVYANPSAIKNWPEAGQLATLPVHAFSSERWRPYLEYFDRAYLHAETVQLDAAPVAGESAAVPVERYIRVAFTPLRRGREVAGVIVTSVDITETIRKERIFRRFVEDNPVGIVMGSVAGPNKGHLSLVNDTYLKLIGYSRAEFEAGEIRWDSITTPESQAADDVGIAEALRYGKAAPYEKEYIHKDGHRIPILVAPTSIAGTNEVLSFVVDLTERKRAEEALRESEQRYRTLFQTMQEGFQLVEMIRDETGEPVDWRYLDVNAAFESMTGVKREDLLGRRFREVLPDAPWEDWAAVFGQVAQTGEAAQFETSGVDRTRRYHAIAYCPRPGQCAAVVSDVTERKQAEEHLRANERRLGLALDAAHAASWEYDLETGRHVWDERFTPLLRVPPEAFAEYEQRWAELVVPEDRDRVAAEFAAACEEGGPAYDSQFRAQRVDGVVRWFHSHGILVREPGSARRLVGVVQDITDRREAEESLRRTEARLSTALEQLGEAVIVATETGELIYWNPAARAMHGLAGPDEGRVPLEEARNTFELWTPDARRLLTFEEWPMSRIMRGGTVRNLELRLRRPDQGWERVFLYSGAMVETGSGERLVYLSAYDLTEQRKIEQALRESEQRYRALFESVHEGFAVGEIICSESGEPVDWRYLDVNPAFESMFGRKREELVGRRYGELFPNAPKEYWVASLGRVALTGNPAHLEQFGTDMGRHYEAIAYSPRPGQFAAIFTDVTERKRAQERLSQSQKLESIGLLAGGIAHDFNNLLTGIMGNASMILDEIDPGPAERIKEVISSAKRGANLTRQLLAYSGKGQFVVRDLNVSEAVHEISGLVEFSIPKSVELAVTVQSRLPVVRMDPSQLQQVLMNLVINAGEAIGEGNPGKITVGTSMADIAQPFVDAAGEDVAPGRYVCVEVRDTGSGIDEENKSKIFDPFFTTKFTGRGLGLAAVAGIIRSQRGGITLESEPGCGSTFRVFLPAATGQAAEAGEQTGRDGRATILVVDDEPSVRDFIGAVLRRKGYRVVVASDGRDALTVCDRENGGIDAVVLDVVMPVMGANELLPQMKRTQPELKVLLTSGYSEFEARRLCAAYPGAAFIQKPYTAQQILRAVDELLGVTRR
ncbi:MAG TPA: PAS domain S-box protein [Bryobacteraceae bacterium]|nr:PAS domain S-box protein [Bryobacteraceae bacterium]